MTDAPPGADHQLPPSGTRLPDFSVLVSCVYLAGAFCYAHFAGRAVAQAWAALMLPIMLGEYVLAFAIAFTLRVREVASENASAGQVSGKSVLGIAVFLLPFLWFVVAGLWKASALMALGYVATMISRVLAAARADADERLRMRRRMSAAVYAFLGTAFIFVVLVGRGLFWGASYYAILAVCEIYLLSMSPEDLRGRRRRRL
ncbi:MAG TPA: hypothetical protein VIF38_10225 [Burkholderiales bacterium]